MLQLQFAPTASGAQSGTLSFASNAGSLAVTLAGEGVAAPTAAASNPNVNSVGAPLNAGGGGALEPGSLLLLIMMIGIMARRQPVRPSR
jgi:hypothetical protein